ncbi:MAG: DEAD/DEAH box helicase [Lentisphaerae bacterium]|jgi:non-specific serine/threonine protein kinase|nr:DEAD/DEAH box helicase [Lentisphaerota bacterium]
MELTLLPEGHFRLIEGDGADLLLTDAAAARIRKAFAASTAEGFLCLAAYDGTLISSLAFGRAFARYYLTALCQSPRDGENAFPAVTPPDEAAWDDWIERAPPLRGLELLDAARANALWQELDAAARAAAESTPGGLDGFLQSIDPVWRTVGRVTFHLAENKKHPERPFAFMATYASRLSEIGRVQHLPLGRALTEYAGARNRKALLHLLAPIQQAVGTSELVRELFESGRLYQPAAWTTQQAYRLLRDLPAIEAAGVIVRVPDWWNARRPPRPRVTVKVGDGKPAQLGAAALLDFNLSVTLGDAELSPEEIQALLNSGCGLVSLRGQWVEVDAGQLKDVLDHWKAVERRAAREGIPFAEAMRLLAGLSAEGPGGDADAAGTERIQAWTGIRAGRWLDETLARLRQPETVGGTLPCADELQATPRPYQETGIRWLHFMASLGLGACLADDMGLGKTLQTLGLLLWLRREGTAHAPSLLVAPASLLANWKDEARRFAPSLRLLVVHPAGDDQERLQACADDPEAGLAEVDLAVTSYGMVARTPWLAQVPWRLVVLDEAQAIKNAATRQARAVKALQSRTRLALTGTPVENRAGDLWSLFDFINPGLLGDARRFGAYIRNRGDQPGAYAPLRRLTRPYILRRLKTDRRVIDDLPEKTVMPAYCGLTPAQAALYADHVRQLREALQKDDASEPMKRRGVILAALMRFKQICNHPAQVTGDGDFAEERSGKFARLRELVEEIAERQDKLLVFTQYREMTEPLAAFLATIFRQPGLVLHGGTPVARRRELVAAFQRDDGPPFFVLSLKAGGTGLNLTQASHVIHFDRWWNPAVENQATDRAFRIGQRKHVIVHPFICRGTVEERIDAMLAEKRGLADELLEGGGEKLLTEMGNDELLRFVALDLSAAGE